MVKKNACVFISGKGTNLKNLLLKSRSYNFPVKFKLVVCNKKNVGGIKIAKKNDIKAISIKNFDTVIKKISTKEKKVICIFGSLYQCGNVLNKN